MKKISSSLRSLWVMNSVPTQKQPQKCLDSKKCFPSPLVLLCITRHKLITLIQFSIPGMSSISRDICSLDCIEFYDSSDCSSSFILIFLWSFKKRLPNDRFSIIVDSILQLQHETSDSLCHSMTAGSQGVHYYCSSTCQTTNASASHVAPLQRKSLERNESPNEETLVTHPSLNATILLDNTYIPANGHFPSGNLTCPSANTSLSGCGSHGWESTTHNSWTAKEHYHQINYLELMVVFKAFWAFKQQLKDWVVPVVNDNAAAAKYHIHKQGGIHLLPLLLLTTKLREWYISCQ